MMLHANEFPTGGRRGRDCCSFPVTAIILLILIIFISGRAEAAVCGDANTDGVINIGDPVFILNHIFRGGPMCDPVDAADVNEDGSVNIGDAVYMLDYIFRNGAFPCPTEWLNNQQVYFEVGYVNYAWGYSRNGFYIDRGGNVYSYRYEYTDGPWLPANPLTWESLLMKYNHNPEYIATVEPDTLQEKIALIAAAAAGPISPGVSVCYDFGAVSYLAYEYDPAAGVYEPALLYQAGDWARKNYSAEAQALFEWLQTYGYSNPACSYPETQIEQEFLFDVTHINFAWGYTCRGFYIDREGNVYSYDHSDEQWQPASDDGYTAEELEEKYSHNRELIGTVAESIIQDQFELIEPAQYGLFSPRINVCFDFGGLSYEAYTYDSETELYHPVFLYLAGDWAQKNMAPEAVALFEWLGEVNPAYADPACGYPE